MLHLVMMLHAYPPFHNAGAETMLHQINRWLVGRGHDVTVMQRDPLAGATWEGVRTTRRGPPRWIDRTIVGKTIVTHLDETQIAESAARRTGSPLVHILHNDKQLTFHGVTIADLIVANSEWVRALIPDNLADRPNMVLYPPTFVADYDTDPAERETITLINLLEGKGAGLFYDLARRLPDRQFVGVTGAYGVQLPAPVLPNLRIVRNRPDMTDVWAETRIYVQPSVYESFGKAAAEAMASAIPVIAHPTDGLLESLGSAGIFADRDDPDAWVEAIANLDNPKTYRHQAGAVRARAVELEKITIDQLEQFEAGLYSIARNA